MDDPDEVDDLDDLERDEVDTYLWRVDLWRVQFECEGERNDHMLHYEQVLGNVFERMESKCCAVLVKVKGEQVITLQMAQQLKTKNY